MRHGRRDRIWRVDRRPVRRELRQDPEGVGQVAGCRGYLTLLERCRGGKGRGRIVAAGTRRCPVRTQARVHEHHTEQYGDGSDGQGGWEGSTPTNTNDPNSTTPMSCYPSYLYVAEKVVAASRRRRRGRPCALGEPTFRVVQACDAAKNAGACAPWTTAWDARLSEASARRRRGRGHLRFAAESDADRFSRRRTRANGERSPRGVRG